VWSSLGLVCVWIKPFSKLDAPSGSARVSSPAGVAISTPGASPAAARQPSTYYWVWHVPLPTRSGCHPRVPVALPPAGACAAPNVWATDVLPVFGMATYTGGSPCKRGTGRGSRSSGSHAHRAVCAGGGRAKLRVLQKAASQAGDGLADSGAGPRQRPTCQRRQQAPVMHSHSHGVGRAATLLRAGKQWTAYNRASYNQEVDSAQVLWNTKGRPPFRWSTR